MSVLTPTQALENRIRADKRNIELYRGTISSGSLRHLVALVADCAASFAEAKRLARETGNHEPLRSAEANLVEMVTIHRRHMP